MHIQGQPAFILHHRHYSESSLILEVLTPAHGRLGLLARGARRPSSPWRGILKPFQPLRIDWMGRGELPILTGADVDGDSYPLSGPVLYCGFYLNELLWRLLHRHDPHEALFADYRNALDGLRDRPVLAETVLRLFEKALLREIGYGLVLDHEVDTQEPIEPTALYLYRPDQGPARIESPARHRSDEGVRIHGSSLLALQNDLLNDPRELREAKTLLRSLLSRQLDGRPLHTRELFRRLVTPFIMSERQTQGVS